MNWNARKLPASKHPLKNITTTCHGQTFMRTQWNQHIWQERVKGGMWQMTVQCKMKSDTLTSSPGASRGLSFAWLICFFKSLVRPCECDYTVYWSTCFTHFVILDSSTRSSTPLLPFFSHVFPTSAFYKMFEIFAVSPHHGLQIRAWNLDIKVL